MKFVVWLLINEAEISKHLHYFIRTSETRESLTGIWSGKKQKGSSISARAFNMAGVERFELPTRGFGIRCSANWSYTPVVVLKT